jgi:hypothetical protein
LRCISRRAWRQSPWHSALRTRALNGKQSGCSSRSSSKKYAKSSVSGWNVENME